MTEIEKNKGGKVKWDRGIPVSGGGGGRQIERGRDSIMFLQQWRNGASSRRGKGCRGRRMKQLKWKGSSHASKPVWGKNHFCGVRYVWRQGKKNNRREKGHKRKRVLQEGSFGGGDDRTKTGR